MRLCRWSAVASLQMVFLFVEQEWAYSVYIEQFSNFNKIRSASYTVHLLYQM